jgi:isoleucyl-tRNA synthetase
MATTPSLMATDTDGILSQADLYLEGSDQHRGWFHSSLLLSCAINGRAPYKQLLTHGFTVDAQGRKMSKPAFNAVAPAKIGIVGGGEICGCGLPRLTTPGKLPISDEILKRVVESYRRIRNTLRFLLANTSDFDPAKDAVAMDAMVELDRRYAIAMTSGSYSHQRLRSTERYAFQPALQDIQTFCSAD